MAPPKKRPPQGRPGQKRPAAGKKSSQARKPAGTTGADKSAEGAPATGTEEGARTSNEAAEQSAAATEAPLSKSAEERKAKREAARQERIAAARKRQRAKRRKQILISILVLIAVGAGVVFAVQRSQSENAAFAAAAEAAGCGPIESFPDELEGKPHLAADETFAGYETNPPTSGVHRGQTAPWGSYREAPDHETLLHNLEHGGVIIHYKDLSDDEVDQLDEFADSRIDGVISIPNQEIEKPIALASWRHMQECDELNTTAIEGFIKERCNKAPEKLGITCAKD
ncbi:hypothetical protein BH23ACT12_BH23ACT12_00980 [soil metagenome]